MVDIMKREDFKKIIKLRSDWKIDRRTGDYFLPSGEKLSTYIANLVVSQLEIDNLGIRENGDICSMSGGDWNTESKEFDNYTLLPEFESNEICSYEEMEKRISRLVREIVQ